MTWEGPSPDIWGLFPRLFLYLGLEPIKIPHPMPLSHLAAGRGVFLQREELVWPLHRAQAWEPQVARERPPSKAPENLHPKVASSQRNCSHVRAPRTGEVLITGAPAGSGVCAKRKVPGV